MNKLFLILLAVKSLNAMDAQTQWKVQIACELQHEDTFKLFGTSEFQHKRLTTQEVAQIKETLQGLRTTAGYIHLNTGLLGLAKKSYYLGNLGEELKFAQMLLAAGANMKRTFEHLIPYPKPLKETGAAPLGHSAHKITVLLSPFILAKGDLRDLFDKIDAGESNIVNSL